VVELDGDGVHLRPCKCIAKIAAGYWEERGASTTATIIARRMVLQSVPSWREVARNRAALGVVVRKREMHSWVVIGSGCVVDNVVWVGVN